MKRLPPGSDVARRDPAIPALAVLLDARGARAAVAKALGGEPASPPVVEYARWKPGVSALLLWRVPLEGGGTARVYAKAYAGERGGADAAKAAARLRGREATFFRALDAPRAVAFVFPYDAGLPGLRRVFREGGLKRALARARPERREAGWRPKARGTAFGFVRYKPENRCVFRVDALWKRDADRRRKRETLFGRSLPARGARRAAELMAGLAGGAGVRLPRTAGFDEESSTLFAHELSGVPLLEAGNSEHPFEATGGALAAFHGALPSVPEAESGTRRLARLRRECAAFDRLGESWGRVALTLLDRIAPRLGGKATALVHGDFHSEQVLVDGAEIGFVDLDGAGRGDPALDVGSFLGHLRLLVRSGDLGEGDAGRAAEAFLRGYGAAPEGLEAACALALLDIGLSSLSRLEATASQRVAGIVEEARSLLEGPSLARAAIHGDGTIDYEFVHATPTGPRRRWEILPPEGTRLAFEDPCSAGPPGMRTALDPGSLTAVLRNQGPRPVAGEVHRTDLLSLRPGRRGVVRARLRDGSSFVVKAYVPGRVPAAAPAAANGLGPRVPRRLGEAPELGLVFFEDLPGELLAARVCGPSAEADLRACALALRAFHAGPPPGRRKDLPGEVRVAERRHEVARRLGGPGHEERAEALGRLRTIAAEPLPAPVARLHGDFHEKQVLVGPDGIAFLDLDGAAAGDPALDVGNFLAHVDLREVQREIDAPAAQTLRAAFLGAYGAGGAGFEGRLALFRSVSLVRLSALHAVRPGGGGIAVGLAARGRETLCFARG